MKIIFYWVFISLISSLPNDEWISLLDKDMSQWETYLSFSHKNGYNGEPPVDALGNILQPLGYNIIDQNVFSVIEENYETHDDWTTLELICFEDKSLHIVNGKVVMVLKNSRYIVAGKEVPLTKGKIQLQSEAAEVYFKNIQIKKIKEMPKVYKTYYKASL